MNDTTYLHQKLESQRIGKKRTMVLPYQSEEIRIPTIKILRSLVQLIGTVNLDNIQNPQSKQNVRIYSASATAYPLNREYPEYLQNIFEKHVSLIKSKKIMIDGNGKTMIEAQVHPEILYFAYSMILNNMEDPSIAKNAIAFLKYKESGYSEHLERLIEVEKKKKGVNFTENDRARVTNGLNESSLQLTMLKNCMSTDDSETGDLESLLKFMNFLSELVVFIDQSLDTIKEKSLQEETLTELENMMLGQDDLLLNILTTLIFKLDYFITANGFDPLQKEILDRWNFEAKAQEIYPCLVEDITRICRTGIPNGSGGDGIYDARQISSTMLLPINEQDLTYYKGGRIYNNEGKNYVEAQIHPRILNTFYSFILNFLTPLEQLSLLEYFKKTYATFEANLSIANSIKVQNLNSEYSKIRSGQIANPKMDSNLALKRFLDNLHYKVELLDSNEHINLIENPIEIILKRLTLLEDIDNGELGDLFINIVKTIHARIIFYRDLVTMNLQP